MQLVDKALAGNRRALARLISQVEDGGVDGSRLAGTSREIECLRPAPALVQAFDESLLPGEGIVAVDGMKERTERVSS